METAATIDTINILRLVISFGIVMALMGGLAIALRYINSRAGGAYTQKRRLKIIETLVIDHKRKAVILRRDNKEHLIILGNENETLIESDIESPDYEGINNNKDHADNKKTKKNKNIFSVKSDTAA